MKKNSNKQMVESDDINLILKNNHFIFQTLEINDKSLVLFELKHYVELSLSQHQEPKLNYTLKRN